MQNMQHILCKVHEEVEAIVEHQTEPHGRMNMMIAHHMTDMWLV